MAPIEPRVWAPVLLSCPPNIPGEGLIQAEQSCVLPCVPEAAQGSMALLGPLNAQLSLHKCAVTVSLSMAEVVILTGL